MTWSSTSLSELVASLRQRGRDAAEVEVKLAAGGCPRLSETLCAFANMPGGGTIVLGLDESDGFAAVGLADPASIEAGIASQARHLDPPVQTTFLTATTEGAVILVVTVVGLPLHLRPCRYQGRAYLRQSDGDYPMSDQEVDQLMAQRSRPRFDQGPVDYTSTDDLDRDLVASFTATVRANSRRLAQAPDAEILRSTRVVWPDGRLTVAGLYALGNRPQQYMPSLSITAAVQLDPRSGGRTRDLVHLDGPLPDLLESAMEWVQRNTRTTIRYGLDGHAYDAGEIPLAAVRELIANALVHRDLSPHTYGKRVEIRLKDDTLVINNPGGLWGLSMEQLGTPQGKSAVNEFLYDLCKFVQTPSRARVIEGEGGGIREVRAALRQANMAPVEFRDSGVSFTALVPRHSLIDPSDWEWIRRHDPENMLTEMQCQIAASMRHGTRWTNALAREEFAPIDSRDALASLQGLVNSGFAQAVGEHRAREYVISPKFRSTDTRDALPRVTIVRIGDDAEQDQLPLLDDNPTEFRPGDLERSDQVLEAIRRQALTVQQIAERTDLSVKQARRRLKCLIRAGQARMDGGQGIPGTVYRATGDTGDV